MLTVDEAMAPGAILLHASLITAGVDPAPTEPSNVAARTVQERGDLEQGFAEADVVVELEFTTKMVHQGYIEPHAAIADTTPNGRSTIWCTSQGQHSMRAMTATVLGWAAVAAEGHPLRDRRRFRRQVGDLPRAARRGPLAEGRPAGAAGHGP